jgi:hypothetical protein
MTHRDATRTFMALATAAAFVPLIGACGAEPTSSAGPETSVSISAPASAPDQPLTNTSTVSPTVVEASAPSEMTAAPGAWPDELLLPTAVDPSGVPIPGSLVTDDNPPDGDILLFTFREAGNTALQSAFSGVGIWAEGLADVPGGAPCVKEDASRAALSGGLWQCDGLLGDGRLVQIATSVVDGSMVLDVAIKRP